jgi:hypothetical protein
MVPVLNKIGTHCAVFGNHDFGELTNYSLLEKKRMTDRKTEKERQTDRRRWRGVREGKTDVVDRR